MEASPKERERERERERDAGLKQMKAEIATNVTGSCGLSVIFIFESRLNSPRMSLAVVAC